MAIRSASGANAAWSSLRTMAAEPLLQSAPKKVVLSGPSGFLGSHVLDSILEVHAMRRANGLEPGEVILLSSSPGNMMRRLQNKYGVEKMRTIRASRVDYYTQHDIATWRDHLGSLGVEGEHAVFVNLAAVSGPIAGKPDAMLDVNYRAPRAASIACSELGFGHWVQSSSQAVNAERAGQVPYSRGKAMLDFSLSHMSAAASSGAFNGQRRVVAAREEELLTSSATSATEIAAAVDWGAELPVSIAALGLLYSRRDGLIGQKRTDASLNLIDLALLPLTPIMGDGSAPLQPQEVTDAAQRLVFLALTNPATRPLQSLQSRQREINPKCRQAETVRFYDAVGPETITIVQMLQKFAEFQGNRNFRPVYIDYRNMELVLNKKSLGNLNRQFVSLLRSEQSAETPVVGNPSVWSQLLGPGSSLLTLNEAFKLQSKQQALLLKKRRGMFQQKQRWFPYMDTIHWALKNPAVIPPGVLLGAEILWNFVKNPSCAAPAAELKWDSCAVTPIKGSRTRSSQAAEAAAAKAAAEAAAVEVVATEVTESAAAVAVAEVAAETAAADADSAAVTAAIAATNASNSVTASTAAVETATTATEATAAEDSFRSAATDELIQDPQQLVDLINSSADVEEKEKQEGKEDDNNRRNKR